LRVDADRNDYNCYVPTYNNVFKFILYNFHFDYDNNYFAGEQVYADAERRQNHD